MYEIDSTLIELMQQQHSARSRPWDKGGGGESSHPDPFLKRGGGRASKTFFFGPGLKIRGEWGSAPQAPPLNPPLQQQVYSVLPFLYNNMVLPTEIQIINR